MVYLSMIVSGALVFAVLDYIWLAVLMKKAYIEGYGRHVNVVDGSIVFQILPAALFYILVQCAVVYFAVLPSSDGMTAFLRGAALGAFGYGLYNLTLAAVLLDYPWKIVLIDWGWGIIAMAIVAFAVFNVRDLLF